jgi:hypothetical protein
MSPQRCMFPVLAEEPARKINKMLLLERVEGGHEDERTKGSVHTRTHREGTFHEIMMHTSIRKDAQLLFGIAQVAFTLFCLPTHGKGITDGLFGNPSIQPSLFSCFLIPSTTTKGSRCGTYRGIWNNMNRVVV